MAEEETDLSLPDLDVHVADRCKLREEQQQDETLTELRRLADSGEKGYRREDGR